MSGQTDGQEYITVGAVRKALSTVQEPELHNDLISLDMVRDIAIDGKRVAFTIVLTTPACPLRSVMERESVEAVMRMVPGVEEVSVRFDAQVRSDSRIAGKLNIPVKNIIAVASGKGGVGKSTVSTNSGRQPGAGRGQDGRVGRRHLRAEYPHDVWTGRSAYHRGQQDGSADSLRCGSDQHGLSGCPKAKRWVWRGPMLHKAIQQLFTDVRWSELDYLIVDLPPGTGDAQLSLAQSVPVTGGIIVNWPQAVSVSDARRRR